MNDPKDIVVTISLSKDNSLNHSNTEENKDNTLLTDEDRFDNLIFHLRENLSKQLYKKTLKEIDVLIKKKYTLGYSGEWKIFILKIKAILKIIKNKIIKYLINHFEKIKIKHHIYSIKKYLYQIPIEITNFIDKYKEINIINNEEMLDNILFCYYEYIFLISIFYKKIGNIIEAISYLSFILRLYKETQLIVKSSKTIYKIENCFILLSQMFICNEDYFSSIEYLNIAMDICLKNIIYQTDDIFDGLKLNNKNILILNNIKNENELENKTNEKKLKRTLKNIVIIYLYKGICYENIGKIKNSIKCYYQCLWFIINFFNNNFKDIENLIKNILEKSIDFEITIDYLIKKINYYEHKKLKIKNKKNKYESDRDDKNSKNNLLSNYLYSKKFKGLVNKLNKLKINEIDTVNKFEYKKNIKCLSSRKREGKDKNIFLSQIRLLNTYLREDFKEVIDDMDKIKSFDLDYSSREKIQKFVRKLYFDQNQKKLRLKQKNKKSLYLSASTTFFKNYNKNKNEDIKSKRYELLNNKEYYSPTFRKTKLEKEKFLLKSKPQVCKQSRAKSAFSRKNKITFSPISSNSNLKNSSNDFRNNSQNSIKDKKNYNNKSKKREFFKRYRDIILSNEKALRKIEEENKELNKFFNKKYMEKRNYIKKLEDRELTFQKNILRLKNTPKIPLKIFNKEVIKQNANDSFYKKMTLLLSTPINWKENLSEEEIKNLANYDKLQNSALRSLDKTALIKYKEEEKKQKGKSNSIIEQINLSPKDIKNNNQNILDKLNLELEELRLKENDENKNYKKFLMENSKYIKKEKKNLLLNNFRKKNRSNIPNLKLKKSFSEIYFF